jgi:hypothetical protein
VHRLCPLDEYCVVEGQSTGGPRPPSGGPGVPYYPDPYGPNAPMGSASFAFEGECVPYREQGEPCFDNTTGESFPCADGLLCSYSGTTDRCMRPAQEGEPCAGTAAGCAFGLYCDYGPSWPAPAGPGTR